MEVIYFFCRNFDFSGFFDPSMLLIFSKSAKILLISNLRREGGSGVILACFVHMKLLFIVELPLFTE